jgi:hypothetical protein
MLLKLCLLNYTLCKKKEKKKTALPCNPDLKKKHWHSQYLNTLYNIYRMSPKHKGPLHQQCQYNDPCKLAEPVSYTWCTKYIYSIIS